MLMKRKEIIKILTLKSEIRAKIFAPSMTDFDDIKGN